METGATTSRGIWGYACGAFAGVASTAILAFAVTHAGSILFMCAYLISLPLFLAGLGAGTASGIIASISATAGIFMVAPAIYGFSYFVIEALPAMGLIALAMRRTLLPGGDSSHWGSEGGVLTALVAYPCLVFLAVYAATAGQDGGLMAMTADALNQMGAQFTQTLTAHGQAVSQEQTLVIQRCIELCTWIMPSLVMCAWIFSTLIAVIVAQIFLQKQNWNLRPNFSLIQLQVPAWVVFAAAATGLGACLAPLPYNYVALNLVVVLGLPFFFVGLAIIHTWAARTRYPTPVLVIFYLTLAIIVHIALLVALLGAVDQWVDFRKRIADGANNQGGKS